MEKTFTVAGTSNLNGVVKFRFANDLKGRIKVLEKNGHTEVNLIELPTAMTKEAAIAYLENMNTEAPVNADDIAALKDSMEAEGESTEGMTDEFLAEVARREMLSEGGIAL
jgi:hypothetical protein